MRNSKLQAVIRHEYMTIVKQPTFWLIMLSIPFFIAVVLGVSYFSNKAMEDSVSEAAKNLENVVVIDESGLINKDIAGAAGIELAENHAKQSFIEKVQKEEINSVVVYPDNIVDNRTYDVYVSNADLNKQSATTQFADTLLRSSIYAPLGSPQLIALAQEGASGNIISYENGQQTPGFASYIVPGAFLVLFYIVLIFSVNYMLTSVAEEKENRSMEMVLSHLQPRTLIFGKLLGISLVTLTQLLFMIAMIATSYFVALQFNQQLNLPFSVDLSALVFDPFKILIGFSVLVLGFLVFAALMAGVGSMVPSAKDAGGLSAIFIVGAIVPFYTFGVISSDPQSSIVQFMSYFPTTAPTTLLIRNALGNLGTIEALTTISVLAIFTVLSVLLAGKLFKLGALEYTNKINLKHLLRKQ